MRGTGGGAGATHGPDACRGVDDRLRPAAVAGRGRSLAELVNLPGSRTTKKGR
jgi:hypothetical protein